MYHIKQDQRSMTSARMLVDGLTDCLKTKELSQISVSELCNAAKVSRTTFYRLFDTPVDALQYAADTLGARAAEQFRESGISDMHELILFYIRFVDSHSRTFESIVNSGRSDIIISSLEKNGVNLVPEGMLEEFSQREREYIASCVASIAVSIYKVNISHGKQESSEVLEAIMQKVWKVLSL